MKTRSIAATLCCVAIVACSSKENDADSNRVASDNSSGASTAAVTEDTTGGGTRMMSATNGPLQELPPNSLTDPTALLEFLKKANYKQIENESTMPRHCDVGGSPSNQCKLWIRQAEGANSLNLNSVPANGAVLALVGNRGPKDDSWSKFANGRKYYWLVVPDPQGAKAVFIDANTGLPIAGPNRVKECKKETHGPAGTTYGYYCCSTGCPKDPVKHPAVLVPSDTLMVTGHTSPPWIACATGCCYADYM